jgi:hypothetical protein
MEKCFLKKNMALVQLEEYKRWNKKPISKSKGKRTSSGSSRDCTDIAADVEHYIITSLPDYHGRLLSYVIEKILVNQNLNPSKIQSVYRCHKGNVLQLRFSNHHQYEVLFSVFFYRVNYKR